MSSNVLDGPQNLPPLSALDKDLFSVALYLCKMLSRAAFVSAALRAWNGL